MKTRRILWDSFVAWRLLIHYIKKTMLQLNASNIQNLGPLSALVGSWAGEKGQDVAPNDDRDGKETSQYREAVDFEFIGQVDNHEQILYGLKYTMKAWRIGEPNAFHEETGYWLWDAAAKQVMKCFIVPRGISVIAGGTTQADAKQFKMTAELGSSTYGIASNLFLDKEFQTVKYEIEVKIAEDTQSFSYQQTTFLKVPYQSELFQHTDGNTLKRV